MRLFLKLHNNNTRCFVTCYVFRFPSRSLDWTAFLLNCLYLSVVYSVSSKLQFVCGICSYAFAFVSQISSDKATNQLLCWPTWLGIGMTLYIIATSLVYCFKLQSHVWCVIRELLSLTSIHWSSVSVSSSAQVENCFGFNTLRFLLIRVLLTCLAWCINVSILMRIEMAYCLTVLFHSHDCAYVFGWHYSSSKSTLGLLLY